MSPNGSIAADAFSLPNIPFLPLFLSLSWPAAAWLPAPQTDPGKAPALALRAEPQLDRVVLLSAAQTLAPFCVWRECDESGKPPYREG